MPAPKGNQHGLSSNPDNINRKGIKGPRGRRSELRKLLKKLSELEDPALAIIVVVLFILALLFPKWWVIAGIATACFLFWNF